jgi:hypothetical protein
MPILSDPEWNRVLPLLGNIDPKRQQAAYNRLVLGMTLVEAGAPFGYSKQAVDGAVKAVMRWWEKLNGASDKPRPPRGWVAVEFIVPQKKLDEVRRVVEAMCPPLKAPPKRQAASKPGAPKAKARPSAGAARRRTGKST